MERYVSQCSACGQTLTAEEIEIGVSLVCPWCEATAREAQISPGQKGHTGIAKEQKTWKQLLSTLRNYPAGVYSRRRV